ncbi:MFS transporter [Nocardiopsis sp. MG754419]|uniref:MFS transporter n=1 Tax=Nocardiopsis sp. MG754419 TaxID=2259865 RepID=UPI001BA8D2E7|nr:MFS transporter [Nocardiopsis sp. MG754419]MBR8740464.1 MFS transporter [Nocardiopsis sp. MG754419]
MQKATPARGPGLGRNFHRFWLGSLAGNLGDGMMLIALPLAAALITDDPLLVSGLIASRYLPFLLFGLAAGVIVDRVDRVRLMVAANLVRTGALVALAVGIATGHAGLWVLYAVMFIVMTGEVFHDLAGRALMPDLAPAGTIDRANGRIEGGRTVTQDFAGGPLAGFLFAIAAFAPIAVNAGAYALGALVLLGLPLAVRRVPGHEEPGTVRASPLADLREGFAFVFRGSSLGPILLFNLALNTAFTALMAVMVLIAQDHFGVPAALYGVFLGSSAVGALLGATTVGLLVARVGRFRLELVLISATGLCFLAFGAAPDAYVAMAAWMLLGYVITSSNIVMLGAIQLIVPGHRLGRVMSFVQVSGTAFGPVAALLAGALGRVELHYVPLASGVLVLVSLALAAPALRRVVTEADRIETARIADGADRHEG